MSTAITSSTSTSTELAVLCAGKAASRGAASAAQAASAAAPPIAPSSIRDITGSVHLNGGRSSARALAPQDAVGLRAHESGKAQAHAHQPLPVVAPDLAAASPGAAGAGEFMIEGKAVGPVIHADFLTAGDPVQCDDRIAPVIAEVGVAAAIDEIDRVTHRFG